MDIEITIVIEIAIETEIDIETEIVIAIDIATDIDIEFTLAVVIADFSARDSSGKPVKADPVKNKEQQSDRRKLLLGLYFFGG